MPTFTMYIDESGNHALTSPTERYLGLTGVICDRHVLATQFGAGIESLKSEFWPGQPEGAVILHRADIVHRRGHYGILNDRKVQDQFDCRLLALLDGWDYTVVSVVIDKHAHRENYATPYPAYHYCLRVLLAQYVLFLEERRRTGSVMAEARNTDADRRLEEEYASIMAEGTSLGPCSVDGTRFQACITNRQLRLDRKGANNAGLQLADLLAHEARAEILDHFSLRAARSHPFQDSVVDIIRARYFRDARTGDIDGHGRTMLP